MSSKNKKIKNFSTIKQMIRMAEEDAGDKIAYEYIEEDTVKSKTFKEFHDDVKALGSSLHKLGLGSSKVACVGENSYRWINAFLSVLASSGVFVPIDKELPEKDLINVLKDSNSDALFFDKRYADILTAHKDELPHVKYFIQLSGEISNDEFLCYDNLLHNGRELLISGYTGYLECTSDPNELKLLVYTSGTTGMAKGVMLSEHNLVSMIYYGLKISTFLDTGLSILPYHHTYESVCGILVAIHFHSTVCINDKMRNILKNLKTFKPSYMLSVPAVAELFYKKIVSNIEAKGKTKSFNKLVAASNASRKIGIDMRRVLFKEILDVFGGRLKLLICGGAPIRPEIGKFFDDIGINMVGGYGITECSPLVSVNRTYENSFDTAGYKLDCIDVVIDNPDNDGIGEICVKGDTVMLGYYNNEEETKKVMIDGYFHTGDYGFINEKGQIAITGRKKNIIVLSNGKNIFPEEIERYIQSIPYVKEVVVYGKENENGEETSLCAEVFLDNEILAEMGITDPADAVKKDVSEKTAELPSYKKVKSIIIRKKEFDKTTSNKIKRNSITKNQQ